MLPYHQLHLLYVAGSGAAAALVWWLWGRHAVLRERPFVRLVAAQATVALLCLGAALLFPKLLDFRDARGFAVVSVTFYADGLWLPVIALVDAARRRRHGRGAAGDPLVVAVSLLAVAVSSWAMLVEPDRLGVRHERVEVAGWQASDEPFLVVHLSDLQTVGSCERELEAVRRVNALEADLIVVSGDYMAGPFGSPGPGVEAARAFLSSLRSRYGVIVVAGHSEPGRLRDEIFDGLDVVYLRNELFEVELDDGRRVLVWGMDVEHPSTSGLAFSGPTPRAARLAVSHVPDLSGELDGLELDLHLAGHTHGGQIALPGFGAIMTLSELPRKYARGLHRFGDHWLNVCAGLGMEGNHAPRIRLFCPPEFCAIELVGTEQVAGMPAERSFR